MEFKMKKLLALLGGVLMIGSSATTVVACGGALMTETRILGTVDPRIDYELWQGLRPSVMDNIMTASLADNETNIKTRTADYLKVDPDGKLRDQIIQAVITDQTIPESISFDWLNSTYLANYFLPVLTSQLALNRFSPAAYINPDLTEELSHWTTHRELSDDNQVWIEALYQYWTFRKDQTDYENPTFREIMLMKPDQAEVQYRNLLKRNSENFKKHDQNWDNATLIIENNDNVLPEDFNVKYLNDDYLAGYLLPWISIMAWNANHMESNLFTKDAQGKKLTNVRPFEKMAQETFDHLSEVLKSNILLSTPSRRWLANDLRYLGIGLTRIQANNKDNKTPTDSNN